MTDREVTVSNRQAQEAAESMQPRDQWVRVTGIDTTTAETVKFKLKRADFLRFYDRASRRAQTKLKVYSVNIISVE
jgi:hypothetical protein